MSTFIMLTRLSHEALRNPRAMKTLSHELAQYIRRDCPEVRWISSFVVLGPADYVDIFSAPDMLSATKVATLVRTFGHATTEIWPATEWPEFEKLLQQLPSLITE
ncbi:GYD domain-containing protein [Rhizobium sp. WYJ-E13]|uniref:GYD domain-containing protein n=1 Tax=unclassified Rhizobium TaxID=2613769 RepID=UPI001C1EC402|nr:GYD domain-containing protein [Rhizobium sp. WYJ-E13]QWW71145.1 GYD domain-containing protein [Rhizobium sp. WYJ-E13]